jgi:hypothetical protein
MVTDIKEFARAATHLPDGQDFVNPEAVTAKIL